MDRLARPSRASVAGGAERLSVLPSFRSRDQPAASQRLIAEKPRSSPLKWASSLKYTARKKQQTLNSGAAGLLVWFCVLCWLSAAPPPLLNRFVCFCTERVGPLSGRSRGEASPRSCGSEKPARPSARQPCVSSQRASGIQSRAGHGQAGACPRRPPLVSPGRGLPPGRGRCWPAAFLRPELRLFFRGLCSWVSGPSRCQLHDWVEAKRLTSAGVG